MNKYNKYIYWLGFIIAVTATAIELFRGGAENYVDFRDATLNFWNGISSYNDEFVSAHGRYFIYSPLFCILFAPFAFMPFFMGGFAWNLIGYTVFYYAVKNLPGLNDNKSSQMMLYLLLFVGQSLFCFQFNLLVAAIFLWAFILLERDHNFGAVFLIMLSAMTKIYGAIELALLFCYPRFWRNMGYAVLCGIGLVLLPVVRLGIDGLLPWYMDWFHQLSDHHDTTGVYYSLIFAQPIRVFALPYMRWFQGTVLAILGVFFFCCYKRWSEPSFRVGVLAGLMGYIVIMSEAAEFTTYTIAATGYALWYFSEDERSIVDKILFWCIFVLFGMMPIDILCPTPVCMFCHKTLWLGVWIFTIAWLRIIYTTCKPVPSTQCHQALQ